MANTDTRDGHHPTVEFVLGAIANWVNKYRRAIGRTNEFGQCDAAEVSRIADDLNIPVSELRALAAKDGHSADLLRKMLAALKVDAKDLTEREPGVMRDLERLCVACDHKRRCRHELADGTAAAHYRAFCPNAFTLDALSGQKANAAAH